MAFQIRCPSCNKLYAAEERMMGKRMRCKACASVFTITAPAEEPSLSAATMPGADPFALSQSDLTGTRKHEPPPPQRIEPGSPMADDASYGQPEVAENPFLRPSIPQDFPMSKV